MTYFRIQNFGGDVIGCPANSSPPLIFEVKFCGEPQIPDLYLHLVCQKQIAQFEVSVDDSVRMQVPQALEQLDSVALHFYLRESFASFDFLVE